MASRVKKQDTVETTPKFPLLLVVHMVGGEEFELDLGVGDEAGVNSLRDFIHNTVFFTVKSSKAWPITDAKGVDYIFNIEHIIAVELRLDRS